MKKIGRILIFGLISVICISGFFYWFGWYKDFPAKMITISVKKPPVKIGEKILVSADIELPLYRYPYLPVSYSSHKGLQNLKMDRKSVKSFGMGTWVWRVQGFLQGYAPEKIQNLNMTISLVPNKKNEDKFINIKIPDFEIALSAKKNQQLVMKPELGEDVLITKEKSQRKNLLYFIIGFFIACVLLFFIYKFWKKRKSKISPPIEIPAWIIAQKEIQNLKESLPMDCEPFFVCLSDIVRTYIEKRFHLKVTEQTTEEFLYEIKHSKSLQAEHQKHLTEFSLSAELVKFAKADTTHEQMHFSLENATTFIRETSPSAGEVI